MMIVKYIVDDSYILLVHNATTLWMLKKYAEDDFNSMMNV